MVTKLTAETRLSSDIVGCGCFSLLSKVTVSSISKLELPSCVEMGDSHKCDAVEKISKPTVVGSGGRVDSENAVRGSIEALPAELEGDAGAVKPEVEESDAWIKLTASISRSRSRKEHNPFLVR